MKKILAMVFMVSLIALVPSPVLAEDSREVIITKVTEKETRIVESVDKAVSESEDKKIAEAIEEEFTQEGQQDLPETETLKSDLEKAGKAMLKPIERFKTETNRVLPSTAELVSSEKSSNEKDVGPRIKLQF